MLWVTWWMGDALGAVLYAPALILLWTDRRPRTRVEHVEGLLVTFVLVAVAAAVFRYGGQPARGSYPLGFLCIPAGVVAGLPGWPARNRGRLGRAVDCRGLGHARPVTGPMPPISPNRGLLLAQTFAGVVAVTTAAVAALVGERQRLYDQLERRVSQRTDQLKLTNDELHVEIAARERVQGALRSSESRLLEAQALAHVGSWEWDVEADHLRWSDEVYRIYGVEPGRFDVNYQSFINMVHRDDRARLEEAVREALATGGLFEVEHRIVRPDGTERTVAGRGRTVCDSDGRPILMLGHGARHHRSQARRRAAPRARRRAVGAAAGRSGEPDEGRVPGDRLARAAHAVERDPRLVAHAQRRLARRCRHGESAARSSNATR